MNPVTPDSGASTRASRLKKRFVDVLNGFVKLDPRGATLFLEGLCAQDDPVVCLGTIVASAHGLSSVQSALRFDLSAEFMNGLGCTVLAYLLKASDIGGDALDNLLFHVVEPPIFWAPFVQTFQQGTLSDDAQLVFAKVLCRLLTLQNQDTTPYRDIANQPSIENLLIASSRHEIREVGHLIRHILSRNGSISACNVLNGPGGRHDNDFADYHDIAILPTIDEILCRQPPFLRTPFDEELCASETQVDDYLDNTFRMLREDMLFDIREEIQAVSQKEGKRRGPRVIGKVSMIGVYTGSKDRKTRWGVKLQCLTDFKELKKMEGEAARVNFLTRDSRGSKVLKHQSLVCLASGQHIISFGTVSRVEELLASKPPVVVFQLDGIVNTRKTIISLCTAENLRLIQLSAATFSFEPVLIALQKMDSFPLAREILSWGPETSIAAPRNNAALSQIASAVTLNPVIDLKSLLSLPTSIHLDGSQARSLVTSLTTRVSLIQGPPGTGKSFIGTILAKAIHDKTSQTILVICYTNHALDQFLGDLLRYNIPAKSIVRLGGRANQSMEHLSLHKQPRGRHQYDWDEIGMLKCDASRYEDRLKTHFDTLSDINDDRNLISHLQLQHHDFFEAFCVPLETEDGMIRVGQNGKAIDEEYLFSRWILGQDAGVLSGDSHVQASARIWSMDHSARQQLLVEWRQEIVNKAAVSICQAGIEYNKVQDAIKQEFGESTVAVLRQKRIIACTTTGAAIYADAIKKIGPEFLLVEEAGEILESHILTALSHSVNQMTLIGDHKQLRPKVNNYQLTVEKGDGYDLNRSLFERLVLKGYPHETLSTQHRMRPGISAFVRELTYPELVDAPSTRKRTDVRGVHSNVVFIDHDHPEDDDALIGDRADGGAQTSKRNAYEVQMVLKIVRYLAQQGYQSENIVVLTPYLGQLHQLRDALKGGNDPILNELDSVDLARVGISSSGELKSKKGRIHLATIDNYQGEESDIVVASLTRSNTSNSIGFMDSPQRLNVLLSRARDGLILIGNSQTFLRSKKGGALWTRFFALLEKGQYAYQGFPAKCERHPERVVLLKHANDFDSLCPHGGCTKSCGFMLTCGHVCPKKCHPLRSSGLADPHDVSQCKENTSAMCPAGHHRVVWECRFGRPTDCFACNEESKCLEEIARQALELQLRREEAEAEHRRRMAELHARPEEEEAAEEKRKLQEEQSKREEVRKKREEEKKQLEEKQRKQAEKKKKREEKQRRREEKKKEWDNQQLQDAIHQREDERSRREEEVRAREEITRQLQEATRKRQEGEHERKLKDKRKREEQTELLREATHKRRDEKLKDREEQKKRLQEATHRRLEEIEHQRRERGKREREGQTKRLREATHKRQEEEEHRRWEGELKKREEQSRRLQEATNRRCEWEHMVDENQEQRKGEHTTQVLEAILQRQNGCVEQRSTPSHNIKAEHREGIVQDVLGQRRKFSETRSRNELEEIVNRREEKEQAEEMQRRKEVNRKKEAKEKRRAEKRRRAEKKKQEGKNGKEKKKKRGEKQRRIDEDARIAAVRQKWEEEVKRQTGEARRIRDHKASAI